MYMYLRHVSGRGYRTQEPFGSTFNALPLSYLDEHIMSMSAIPVEMQ